MAAAVPYAILALTTYSVYTQYEAGQDAKKLASYNAKLKLSETEEEARRLEAQQQREEAMARAVAASSGVRSGQGSVANFLQHMKDENLDQLNWLKKSGVSQAEAIKMGGKYEARAATGRAAGTAAQGFTSFGQSQGWLSS